MQDYLSYPQLPPPGPSVPASGAYQVLVEYANAGQAKPPTLVDLLPALYRTLEDALQAAYLTAYEYRPPDPWSPRSRTVYADGPQGYLTLLEGAVATFHFRSRVVHRLPDHPVGGPAPTLAAPQQPPVWPTQQ